MFELHPEKFVLLQEKSFLAWATVVMSYGIAGYERASDESVIRKLKEDDIEVTRNQVDEYRKIGLCILGWSIEHANTKARVQTIEHDWQQKQKGDIIMASQTEIRSWLHENLNETKDGELREQEAMFITYQETLPKQARVNVQFVNALDKFARGYEIGRIASELEIPKKEAEKQLYVACSLVGYQPPEGFNKHVRRMVSVIEQMSHQAKNGSEGSKPEEVFGPVRMLSENEPRNIRVSAFQKEIWNFAWLELTTRPNAEVQDGKAVLHKSYAPVLRIFVEQCYPDAGLDIQWIRSSHWDTLIKKGAIEVIKDLSGNKRDNTYFVLNPEQEGLTIDVFENTSSVQARLDRKIEKIELAPCCAGLWKDVFRQAKAVKGSRVKNGTIQWHGSASDAIKSYIKKDYSALVPALANINRAWFSKTWDILIDAGLVSTVEGRKWHHYHIGDPNNFQVVLLKEEPKLINKLLELVKEGVGRSEKVGSVIQQDQLPKTPQDTLSLVLTLEEINVGADRQIPILDAEIARMNVEIATMTQMREELEVKRQKWQKIKDAFDSGSVSKLE